MREFIDAGDYASWRQSVSDRLSASTSAEHLHLAALLATDKGARIELITRAITTTPSHPFVVWSAVRLCMENHGAGCPLDDWLVRLINIDSGNSLAWAQLAMHRYSSGESAAALNALRRGAAAAMANDYWVDVVALSVDSLAAASDLGFVERASLAFGISAMQTLPYHALTAMCRDESRNAGWAYACLDFGAQLENEATSELSGMIALAIQRLAAETQGDEEQLAAIESRETARGERMREASDALGDSQFLLVASSPSIFESYLERIRQEGEISAAISFNEDIQALKEQRPDLACAPAR
jgi:hypothetical protein